MDARRVNGRRRGAGAALPAVAEPDGTTSDDDDVVRRRRGLTALTRGILLARRRRFDAARAAFADALRADAALELTDDPAFWELERSAHLAAIDACRDVGRERDANVLEARLSVVYRPRLLHIASGDELVRPQAPTREGRG